MKRTAIWLMTAICIFYTVSAEESDFDLAPFFQIEKGLDYSRLRALGPILEQNQDAKGRKNYAVRPFFSRHEDFSREFVAQDILYPVLSYRLNGIKLQQRGVVGVSIDDNVYDPDSSWQDYIMPLYFNGRSKDGQRYFAIFPLGGDVRDVFSYKLMRFYAFPCYMKTIKSNDVVSEHILWPIFHKADGERVKKRKVFPLIGYSEAKGKWRQNFALWPLFHWGYSLDPKVEGRAHALFPLYSHMWMRNEDNSRWVDTYNFLFPFFLYSKGSNQFRLHAPWPFIQHTKGEKGPGSSKTWLWPIWGETKKRGNKETFWLWPLYFDYHRTIPGGERRMKYIFIFWMNAMDKDLDTGEWNKFTRIWPFASYQTNSKGEKAIKVFDLFPMRHVHAVERNLSPIWQIYTYYRTTERRSHDLLWGLVQYRQHKNDTIEKCSVFPLFNYEVTQLDKIRKFYLGLGLYGRKDYPDGAYVRRYGWLFAYRKKGTEVLGHSVLPFYQYEKDHNGTHKKTDVLLGLYGNKLLADGTQRKRYGWLFSKDKKDGQTTGHSLFPFYSRKVKEDGEHNEFNLLTGLFGTQKKADGSRNLRLFWFLRIPLKGAESAEVKTIEVSTEPENE